MNADLGFEGNKVPHARVTTRAGIQSPTVTALPARWATEMGGYGLSPRPGTSKAKATEHLLTEMGGSAATLGGKSFTFTEEPDTSSPSATPGAPFPSTAKVYFVGWGKGTDEPRELPKATTTDAPHAPFSTFFGKLVRKGSALCVCLIGGRGLRQRPCPTRLWF